MAMNPYDPNAEQPQLPKQALLQMLAGGGDPTQSGMQQAGNAGMFEPAIGAIANAAPGIAAAAAPTGPANSMPQGIDPALAAIYQKAGQNPAGRGTGFADWQYWQGVGPSQYGRLASDIAGSGPDQTTGTPWGAGAWQGSGQGGSGGGGSQMPQTLSLSGLNPILQGNATSNINNALQNIGAMTKGNSYLQSLIDALGSGGQQ